MIKKPYEGAHAIFSDWLKKERKSIFEVFGKSKSDYVRGLRRELSAVENAYKRAWKLSQTATNGLCHVYDSNNQTILDHIDQSNAAYIVKACNAYPELVKASKGMLAWWDNENDELLAEVYAPDEIYRIRNLRALLASLGELEPKEDN